MLKNGEIRFVQVFLDDVNGLFRIQNWESSTHFITMRVSFVPFNVFVVKHSIMFSVGLLGKTVGNARIGSVAVKSFFAFTGGNVIEGYAFGVIHWTLKSEKKPRQSIFFGNICY